MSSNKLINFPKIVFSEMDKIVHETELADDCILSIGRSSVNDIVFIDQTVSSKHGQIEIENKRVFITDFESTNGTFIDDLRLLSNNRTEVLATSKVKFGNLGRSQLAFSAANQAIQNKPINTKEKENSKLTIGRNPDCDIFLDDPTVSRFHATIEKNGEDQFELIDLNSTNGTYFKGKKIVTAQLNKTDKFLIGKFVVSVNGLVERLDERTAVRIENGTKVYSNGNVGLHPITFDIKPKTLTAIMGPSGCGKSTLLKILNGISRHTSGKVYLFDLEIDKNFDSIKRQIGYVPQDDIVHLELTVYQSIYFAAKLRLENETDVVIKQKIDLILKRLKIDKIRGNLNSEISGGQRKRVCIAIELLSDPLLLLLDEPTSPLDPQSIEEFMQILKELVSENTTIIMVTHKPEDLQFMDDVIFLAEGGHFAFKGNTDSYLSFFNVTSTIEVYSELSGVNTSKWIGKNSNELLINLNREGKDFDYQKVKWWLQLYWLTFRSLQVKTNDKLNTAILILQAPLIALLIGLIFTEITLGVLFMMIISSVWFGVNNAAREIVREKEIFLREKLFNIKVSTYLLSKLITLTILAIIQTGLFVLIIQLRYSFEEITLGHSINNFFWLLFISVVSSLLGLLISASMKTTDKVMALVPILLIPQIMLAGVITKISSPIVEVISYLTFSRWGTEGLGHVQGDVSLDTKVFVYDSAGLPVQDSVGEFVLKNESNSESVKTLLNEQYHESYTVIFGKYSGDFFLDFIILFIIGITLYFSINRMLNKRND